jgi:hypothetical protein
MLSMVPWHCSWCRSCCCWTPGKTCIRHAFVTVYHQCLCFEAVADGVWSWLLCLLHLCIVALQLAQPSGPQTCVSGLGSGDATEEKDDADQHRLWLAGLSRCLQRQPDPRLRWLGVEAMAPGRLQLCGCCRWPA